MRIVEIEELKTGNKIFIQTSKDDGAIFTIENILLEEDTIVLKNGLEYHSDSADYVLLDDDF